MTITTEQKVLRNAGIGGSDASCILNMNPWKSAIELYREKRGEEETADFENEQMWAGTMLEKAIGQMYAVKTGRRVREESKTFYHPEHDFILGHVDFLSEDDERGIEVKNVGYHSAGAWGDDVEDNIPDYYRAQVAHYSLITGIRKWDFAVLIGGQKLKIIPFEVDDETRDVILQAEIKFWDCVQKGIPPEVDPAYISSKRMGNIFQKENGSSIICTEKVRDAVGRLKTYKENKKACDGFVDEAEAEIKAFMGESSVLEDEDGKALCTWKNRKDKSLTDWEGAYKFIADTVKGLPEQDLMEQTLKAFTKTKPGSRTFLVKK